MSYQDAGDPSPSYQVDQIIWLDVNSKASSSHRPLLVPNVQAINNSLYNLIKCPIGSRGPIFQPEYGTILYRLLHEPLDWITSNKLRISLIQAIQRWEPRIILDMNRSQVRPDYNRNAFIAEIYYEIVSTQTAGNAAYLLNRT